MESLKLAPESEGAQEGLALAVKAAKEAAEAAKARRPRCLSLSLSDTRHRAGVWETSNTGVCFIASHDAASHAAVSLFPLRSPRARAQVQEAARRIADPAHRRSRSFDSRLEEQGQAKAPAAHAPFTPPRTGADATPSPALRTRPGHSAASQPNRAWQLLLRHDLHLS